MKIIIFGFLLRFILAIIDNYFFSLPGGEFDPGSFHLKGVQFKEYLETSELNSSFEFKFGWIYSIFLGAVYYLFGVSKFMAASLSCVTWFISALVLRKIMIKLNFNKELTIIALIIYSFFFPSSILYSSFALREAYLLLFSNLIFLFMLNFFQSRTLISKFKNLTFFLSILFLLFFFHKAGALFIGSIFGIIIPYIFLNKLNFKNKILQIFSFLLILSLVILFEYFGIFEKIFLRINGYQLGHFELFENFRAHYYERNEIMIREYSLINFLSIMLQNNFNYFFQPTILDVSEFKDIAAIFENSLRLFFIFIIIYKMFVNFENKQFYIILFLLFFLMESIYAQATVNYGTALRHHMTSIGYLILLLFFPLKTKFRKSN
jgi:hypothetical protein